MQACKQNVEYITNIVSSFAATNCGNTLLNVDCITYIGSSTDIYCVTSDLQLCQELDVLV